MLAVLLDTRETDANAVHLLSALNRFIRLAWRMSTLTRASNLDPLVMLEGAVVAAVDTSLLRDSRVSRWTIVPLFS